MTAAVVIPVWNGPYAMRWLEWSLPSLFSSGNLGALDRPKVFLVSRKSDLAEMPKHRNYARLAEMAEIVPLGIVSQFCGPEAMPAAYQRGFAAAQDCGAETIYFANADVILSDGLWVRVRGRLEAGSRAVMGQGLPVNERRFFAETKPGEFSASELVRHVLRCTHNGADLPQWTGPFRAHPSQFFWPGENGFIMRTWHLFPFAVRPKGPVSFAGTVDNDLLECCGFAPEEISYITHSGDGCLISIEDDPLKSWGPPCENLKLDVMQDWARNTQHRTNFKKKIYWSAGQVDWSDLDAQADQAMAELFDA